MASSSSGGIPNITPSQVAIVNADLPINKLLDHLIVKIEICFFLFDENFSSRKINDYFNHYHRITRKNNRLQHFFIVY